MNLRFISQRQPTGGRPSLLPAQTNSGLLNPRLRTGFKRPCVCSWKFGLQNFAPLSEQCCCDAHLPWADWLGKNEHVGVAIPDVKARKTILVIEDNILVRLSAVDELRKAGLHGRGSGQQRRGFRPPPGVSGDRDRRDGLACATLNERPSNCPMACQRNATHQGPSRCRSCFVRHAGPHFAHTRHTRVAGNIPFFSSFNTRACGNQHLPSLSSMAKSSSARQSQHICVICGYRVIEAANGDEALPVLRRRRPRSKSC